MDIPRINEEKQEHPAQNEFSEGFLKIVSDHLKEHNRGSLRLRIPVTVELTKSEDQIATKVRDFYLAIAKKQMEKLKPVDPKQTSFSYDLQCVIHPVSPRSLQVNLSLLVLMTIHPKKI